MDINLQHIQETLTTELLSLIRDFGKDGGLISPSIYDTSQYLRLLTPQDPLPTLEWILTQQESDGGWGDFIFPLCRDLPTVSAILALAPYQNRIASIKSSLERAFHFLDQQHSYWEKADIEAVPLSIEFTLLKLIEDDETLGLKKYLNNYSLLHKMREKKINYLKNISLKKGDPLTYLWECLDRKENIELVDEIGSIGTSPASTMAFLARYGSKIPTEQKNKSQEYLLNASKATQRNLTTIFPPVWPINRFDQEFGLYAVDVADLDQKDDFTNTALPVLQDLYKGYSDVGNSYCDYFLTDLDCSSVAFFVLKKAGYDVPIQSILRFQIDGNFYTFPGEINCSTSSLIHALHALYVAGELKNEHMHQLLILQKSDGRWSDKWHASWLYPTTRALILLLYYAESKNEFAEQTLKAMRSIIKNQNSDGGWGVAQRSTQVETGLALLSLRRCKKYNFYADECDPAIKMGYQYLLHHYKPNIFPDERLWLAKELYSEYRVDRAIELSALLSLTLEKLGSNP